MLQNTHVKFNCRALNTASEVQSWAKTNCFRICFKVTNRRKPTQLCH